jgi:hypothetical protein
MNLTELRNRILIPIGLVSGLAYILILLLIGFSVSAENRVGTLIYFLGWLLVGHGSPTPLMPLSLPYVAVVLTLTFALWWLLTRYLRFLNPRRNPNLALTVGAWLLALPAAAIIVLVIGHMMLYLGENMVQGTPQIPLKIGTLVISEDLLGDWSNTNMSPVIDLIFVITLPIAIIYGFYQLLKGYNIQGFQPKGGK